MQSSPLMFWILIGVVGLYFLYPIRKSLRFGIDLVGGTYLTLEVQTDKAVEAELHSRLQSIITRLKRERSISLVSKTVSNETIILTFENQQQTQDAVRILKADFRELTQSVDKNSITLSFPEQMEKRIKNEAVSRNIAVLHARLDRFSVAEIPILRSR